MPVRLRELYLSIDHGPGDLALAAARALGVGRDDVSELTILRRAIDARRKPSVRFVYTVLVSLADAAAERRVVVTRGEAEVELPVPPVEIEPGRERLEGPVLVVGAGPAGLFAALRLAEHGYAPVVIERGLPSGERGGRLRRFVGEGELDPECNVVFGEGGAGAYSDGKLTHRSKRGEARLVIDTLADCGAPEDVTYDARPHVGSDLLPGVVRRLRERIVSSGGTFRFGCRASGFAARGGRLRSVTVETPAGREELSAGALLLAPGLSARDTWRALLDAGVDIECRPTLVGVRVEHAQETVDRAQYGALAGHPRLPPAEYFLKRRGSGALRPVHSFCMCPGGRVIPVASAPGMLSTNGMSRRARDSGYANAALVCSVGPEDYGGDAPLAGAEFIEHLERETFAAGGGDYSLPSQGLRDFLEACPSRGLPPGPDGVRRRLARVWDILPAPVVDSIREAARAFARQIGGFAGRDAGVYGTELRVSSPVRIVRGDDGVSRSARDLYPAGEGAGYAGGIVSSAVDGLRQAARVVRRYARPG